VGKRKWHEIARYHPWNSILDNLELSNNIHIRGTYFAKSRGTPHDKTLRFYRQVVKLWSSGPKNGGFLAKYRGDPLRTSS
jgi:hypothetical protein